MSPYTENNQSVTPGLANSEAGGSYEHGGADRWNQVGGLTCLALFFSPQICFKLKLFDY